MTTQIKGDRLAHQRILLTNFYGDMGGGEFALLAHAEYLAANGKAVHVCLVKDGPFASMLREKNFHVDVLGQRLDCGPRGAYLKAMTLVPRLVRYIRAKAIERIVCYTDHEMPFFALAGTWCNVPVIFRDQLAPADQEQRRRWREKWLPWLYRRCLAGIVATTAARVESLKARGLNTQCLSRVYLGTDVTKVKPVANAREVVSRELGIPVEAPLLGFFGRLIALKDHPTFLVAMAGLSRRDAHALIVGGIQLNDKLGSDYQMALQRQVAELNLTGRVHFTGFRSDVPVLMSACDIICHSSMWETFGLVLVEAMLCGKPIVASDVSGPREIVVPGRTGLLFPPKDSAAMTEAIDKLVASPQLRESMGQAGMQRARLVFDQKTNLRALEEVIDKYVLAWRNGRGG